jgi:hypothetical protein
LAIVAFHNRALAKKQRSKSLFGEENVKFYSPLAKKMKKKWQKKANKMAKTMTNSIAL